jgi:hypothetical protein
MLSSSVAVIPSSRWRAAVPPAMLRRGLNPEQIGKSSYTGGALFPCPGRSQSRSSICFGELAFSYLLGGPCADSLKNKKQRTLCELVIPPKDFHHNMLCQPQPPPAASAASWVRYFCHPLFSTPWRHHAPATFRLARTPTTFHIYEMHNAWVDLKFKILWANSGGLLNANPS